MTLRHVAACAAALLIAPACAVPARSADGPVNKPPSAAQLRAEAERVPAHVQTWLYYGLVGVNERVAPELMARYADFVEDGDHGEFAAKFKAAGGRYAAAYTDPSYVPYCDPPFTPPVGRCKWEYGRYVTDETGWFHGPDGSRIRHYVPGDHAYQEAINGASPAAHRAWREFTRAVKRRAPAIDFLFADDSGAPLHAGDMSPKSAHFYDFNEAGVEIQTDDAFRDAFISYLGESALPLILNGADPVTGAAAYGGAFIRQPFVRGNTHEGCFRYERGIKTLSGDRWTHEQDALLDNARTHRWGICMMTGTPTLENRLYALASFWIGYDPQWSVAAPLDAVPGQSSLLPEFSIVPRFPLRSATAHASELRAAGGAYVREFWACFHDRVPIGGCAAVVNPGASTVPMPDLHQQYRHSLLLAGGDVVNGGAARWIAGAPSSLGPGTAVVLAR